jgi:hypothetical protein
MVSQSAWLEALRSNTVLIGKTTFAFDCIRYLHAMKQMSPFAEVDEEICKLRMFSGEQWKSECQQSHARTSWSRGLLDSLSSALQLASVLLVQVDELYVNQLTLMTY